MKSTNRTSFRKVLPAIFAVGILFTAASGYGNSDSETVYAESVSSEEGVIRAQHTNIAAETSDDLPLFREWKNFTKEDGLPSNKISAVRIDGDRVWVGTDKGLAIFEDGEFTVITTEDGLSHNYVLGIDVSDLTGEVWIATMSGLTRWSAGEMTVYTQFNSGLANDVVYSVVTDDEFVWTATAAGASKFNTYIDRWEIFNEQNAPMHEPWTYGVAKSDKKIYIAAWGGGILEYFKDSGQFRVHKDPDHQMQIDLYPDDGVAHDITTVAYYANETLWVGTYFGLSRYDGTRWSSFYEHDSGLASDFINYLKAQDNVAYICTDKGFSTFNGRQWVTYKNENGTGNILINDGDSSHEITTSTTLANNFIWAMDVQGDEIWLATADGLSYSKASGPVPL